MSVRDAYTAWSATYDHDRNLTRDLDAEVTRAALADQRVAAILEIGCGTGKNTALLADLAPQVLALDFSEGMLAQARAKVPAPHVAFRVADLTQPWPAESQSAELVVGNLVLEHVEDLNHIFREAARVLRPGGRFFVSELHPFKQYSGSQARFEQDGEVTPIAAFVHHLSDFTEAARAAGFSLQRLQEWWHPEDRDGQKPPRLVTFWFTRY